MQDPHKSPRNHESFPTFSALRKALLIGACVLVMPAFAAVQGEAATERPDGVATKAGKPAGKAKKAKADVDTAKADGARAGSRKPSSKGAKNAGKQPPGPPADFGKEAAPADVVHVANWVSYTRDNRKKSFVLIDKKGAQLYVFDPRGKLRSRTPVLLGKAVGDDAAPGIGNKPLSKMTEDEKTTPAGRFLAAPGRNTKGEDIIWIDYNTAVSMHRLRKVSAEQKRAERMATDDPSDNRISYGCVNVPATFFDSVLKPTVVKQGAYVYVLPETRTPQQQFGSFDLPTDKVKLAEKEGKDKDVRVAEAPASSRRAGR
jgi:hypothetical protein